MIDRKWLEEQAQIVVNRVCEYDDRTSPEDDPDMLLITAEELHSEIMSFADEILDKLHAERPALALVVNGHTHSFDEDISRRVVGGNGVTKRCQCGARLWEPSALTGKHETGGAA